MKYMGEKGYLDNQGTFLLVSEAPGGPEVPTSGDKILVSTDE